MTNLTAFLNDDTQQILTRENDFCILIKVTIGNDEHSKLKRFLYIYQTHCDNVGEPTLALDSYFNFIGVYDKVDKILYRFDDYKTNCIVEDFKLTKIQAKLFSELKNEMINKITPKVIRIAEETISNEKEELEFLQSELERLKFTAMQEIVGSYYNKPIEPIELYFNFNLREYLHYIVSGDSFIDELTNKYLARNLKFLRNDIIKRKEIEKLKKEIQETNKYPIEKQQLKVFKAVSKYKYVKSFTVLYRISKKELKFKVKDTYYFKNYVGRIDMNYSVTKKQSAIFEDTFRTNEDPIPKIKPEYIEKITYGRDIIFEKESR